MPTQWGRAFAALVCCCCAATASAQKNDGIAVREHTAVPSAALVPSDVSLYISIEGAAKLRHLPPGQFVESSIAAIVPQGNVRNAWRELSHTLKMTPERTFDRLLGTRVTLAARPNNRGAASWAILTEIDKQTFDQLTNRLKPAPRKMLKGRTVFTLEQGEFLLTAHYTKKTATALALLGPRNNPGLFEEIAASFGGINKDPLLKHPDFAKARGLDRNANVLFFTRRPHAEPVHAPPGQHSHQQVENGGGSGDGGGSGGWGGWLALTATANNNTIAVKGLSFTKGAPKPTRTWSTALFEKMSKGALVSIVDDAFLDAMPFDPIGLLNLKRFEHNDVDDLLTNSWAFRVTEQDGALAFEQAVATQDIDRLAPRADRLIAEILADRLDDPALIDNSFESFDPSVTRSVNLASLVTTPSKSPLGPTPALAWRFDRDPEPEANPAPGWWVIASSADAVGRLASDLASHAPNDDPWTARGLVRPAKIAERIPLQGAAPALVPFIDPLSRLDRVDWRAAPAQDDLLYIQIDIQLTERHRARIKRVK